MVPHRSGGRSRRALSLIALSALALSTLPAAEPANLANSAAVSYTFKTAVRCGGAGLKPLFNGKDFTGWIANPDAGELSKARSSAPRITSS